MQTLKCLHRNLALEIPVEDISIPLPLRDVCLRKIASNSSYFQLEQVSCLPNEVLTDLIWKLSVYDLLLYSQLFEKRGIDTAEVWERHCLRRYKAKTLNKLYFGEDCRSSWSSDNLHKTAKVLYLHHYCSDLLFENYKCSDDCQFEEDLKFYLKHTPSLTVKWSNRYKEKYMANVLTVIQETVQHLEISVEYSANDFTELLMFLNSCRYLKSIVFKSCGLLCEYLSSVENTGSNIECIVDSVEAKLDDLDVLFLKNYECSKINLRKLDLTFANTELMYHGLLFRSPWLGMTLNNLTHLTIDGTTMVFYLDVLLTSLLDMFKNPSRQPLKYLGLRNFGGTLDIDLEKYKGQGLMVERFELLSPRNIKKKDLITLLELLKNNVCLSELTLEVDSTMFEFGPHMATELHEAVIDICQQRNMISLVMTDIEYRYKGSIHQILSHSEDLEFLKIKSFYMSTAVDPDKSVESIASHSNLVTLSLHGINFGVHVSKLLELIFLSHRNLKFRNLCLSSCLITGDHVIEAGHKIKDSACRRKLHVLDISMNLITRLQQGVIKELYHCLTDILIVDMPDNLDVTFYYQFKTF